MQDGTQLLLSQSQRKQPQVSTNQSKNQQQFGEELMSHKSAKELLSNRSDVVTQDETQLLSTVTTTGHNKPIKKSTAIR